MNYLKIELSQLNDLKKLLGKKIAISGIIGKIRTGKFRNGHLYSILELTDKVSSFEFCFIGVDYLSFNEILIEGQSVELMCSIAESLWQPGEIYIKYIAISDDTKTLERITDDEVLNAKIQSIFYK